ncbi:MAG: nucleotide sugar dehydrogenase [Candidatus Woesearchaeota archaeon]
MKVSIIGLGYVGLPLALAIAKKHEIVIGIDLDIEKINKIKSRVLPIEDKQAEIDIKSTNLQVSNSFDKIKDSDIVIICVPTPVKENKDPDLTPVIDATKSILPYLKKNQIVILESTVNPGVCDDVILPILEKSGLKAGIDFNLSHCPERINPGDEKWNVYNIARNVGSTSREGCKLTANFYRSFINAEINEMSCLKAAEATKIIENTFRDVNLAYVNELAKSFDVMGLDILEIINGANNKPFAFMAHYPGCGVGGHCIPVDPYYLIEKAKSIGFDHKFLKIAREVNNSMPEYTVNKLILQLNYLGLPVKGTKIGLLGLSYKANVGDLRESPALEIKKRLLDLGAELFIYDPYIEGELNELLDNCIGVILATNHKEFLSISDWKNVKVIIDGRNCLDKDNICSKGILYQGIGR